MVHIYHSYVLPDMVGCQDALLWSWDSHCYIIYVDCMSLHWWNLFLPGLFPIHLCFCCLFRCVVEYFLPILRPIFWYPYFLPLPEMVDYFSLLKLSVQDCNHNGTHRHNFICLFSHHMGHNLNHCPLTWPGYLFGLSTISVPYRHPNVRLPDALLMRTITWTG